MIQKDPGFIIGPITKLLGVIFNFVFNLVHRFTVANSLGISIIIITIIVRILLWPLAIKQVKNSVMMQHIQPELKKLQQKYPNKKDPESQKKLQLEIQKLHAKNNINPVGGCILAFIQLPIIWSLSRLLYNSYCYIDSIGKIYQELAQKIMSVPDYVSILKPIAIPKVPAKMMIDLSKIPDLQKVINKFTTADWTNFLSKLDTSTHTQLSSMLLKKESVERFCGIDLIDPCGLNFPGVMIPILAAVTTFLTSYFMNKIAPQVDENVKKRQKWMLIIMPVLMGFLSLTLSSGVGVYWITSSVIQLVQQIFANNYSKKLRGLNDAR